MSDRPFARPTRWTRLRWRCHRAWNVVVRWWWMASGERQRIIEERDRYKENAEFRFKQMREATHAVYMLGAECVPASVDTLRRVADQIDCGPDCEDVSPMDWSTGVRECHLSDRGECPFDDACELRDLAAALETYAAVNKQEARDGR